MTKMCRFALCLVSTVCDAECMHGGEGCLNYFPSISSHSDSVISTSVNKGCEGKLEKGRQHPMCFY